ncbi:flagellar biosynthesis protein FlhA [Acidothermus cellulolyticus 11B]|uniref:Flagellar biosynthesis protein FlhA n=1 Tax=Acidothermus cellulolyticus (strain ATCC 43068 / DSM 8971 / 11B) TaxID=351607 RepID=A0LT74_ACIC1|nr:flagellar biosynthesis protein FlhA [Acidothermus cellulolyticus 11B]
MAPRKSQLTRADADEDVGKQPIRTRRGGVRAKRLGELGIPAGVIAIIVMMVVPLPTALLDVLLATNITFALLVLLVSMFVKRPLDFAAFPSLLLIATLFRLALNISVTRLVLLHGYAGKVVQSFGHFVVGGSLVVGLVIFLIILIIQFVVITNGAGRVAEVGARFTLDAMPGKQMAIDADLNAGLIDEAEARRRRSEIAAEADFYGAMDGASKFVKGDAIAAVVITGVNLIGGLAIGILQRHLSIGEAVNTYSLLSVGDGLVSQIPALLLSVSTGLIVTRGASEADMGADVLRQIASQRQAIRIGGAAILVIALIPGLPKLPFLILGGAALALGMRLKEPPKPAEPQPAAEPAAPAPDSPEALVEEMRVEPLELNLAFDLVDLVDQSRGGELLERVRALRRKLALELGMVIPMVRTRDNLDLPPGSYAIRVNGVEVARGEAPPGAMLAIGENLTNLPGTATIEPVFGLPGKWLAPELRQQAEMLGATVVDRASVITTHLAEVVRDNAAKLLSREDVKTLTELTRRTHPVVVEELTPALLQLGDIQRVLQGLLDEHVPIRDLPRIFEALSQRARVSQDPEGLIEAARATLGPAISAAYAQDGRLSVLTIDPLTEQRLVDKLRHGEHGSFLALDPDDAEYLVGEVRRLAERAEQLGNTPVLACAAPLRPALRRLVRSANPRLPVLAYGELGPHLQLETVGTVSLAHAHAA